MQSPVIPIPSKGVFDVGRNARPPDLVIALDFGGSATKGVYADASLNEKLLLMEPEVISLPQSAITNYEQTKLGSAEPADSAWVVVDEQCYRPLAKVIAEVLWGLNKGDRLPIFCERSV
jgi:hypothetical protein